uniref:Acyl-coenzyme A thioesterase 1-like n=2 Tax=Hirondellea gigas TaxID=1518452 RepID=A0A2P2I0J9_9CRUS
MFRHFIRKDSVSRVLSSFLRSLSSSSQVKISEKMAPSVTVTPDRCLQDVPVTLRVTGLSKNEHYTISSSINDSKGVTFVALAHYRSDETGTIDVTKQPALGGHFLGLFPMGLFFNIMPNKSDYKHHRFSYKDVTKPLLFDIAVYEGSFAPHIAMMSAEGMGLTPVCTVEHSRLLQAPGSKRIIVNEGKIRGVLHLPPGRGPFPGVVDMFGSAGGLMEHRSSLLAARGIAALALAFFDYEDLPKTLDNFHMSYFEEAVNYLASREEVYGDGVGAISVSKGGDLVLSMARHLPLVKAGVVINCCAANAVSTLTLNDGTVIPALKFDISRVRLLRDGCMDAHDMMDDLADYPECAIEVERIPGDIMWIVGVDDKNWDSVGHAQVAVDRYKKAGRDHKLQVLKYEGAGHLIEPPYTPFCDLSYHKVVRTGMVWGGQPKQHCQAQVDSWQRIQDFFHDRLTPDPKTKL